jgi:hypothetical protein
MKRGARQTAVVSLPRRYRRWLGYHLHVAGDQSIAIITSDALMTA